MSLVTRAIADNLSPKIKPRETPSDIELSKDGKLIYYFCHLGQTSDGYQEQPYKYEIPNLYRGTYQQCLDIFFEDMVGIFSAYGQGYVPEHSTEIETSRDNRFKVSLNEETITIKYDKNKQRDGSNQRHLERL